MEIIILVAGVLCLCTCEYSLRTYLSNHHYVNDTYDMENSILIVVGEVIDPAIDDQNIGNI